MDVDECIGRLEAEGSLLTAVIEDADWNARVPATSWDLRSLVVHVGAVHRWANDAIVRRLAINETRGSSAFRGDVPDAELRVWFADGLAAIVATLRAAGDDLSVFTFLQSPTPRHFWARRQAHETAIHRADAEAAIGDVTPFDADFAQDGLAELVGGFAYERGFASDTAGTLALDCTDGPSWLVTFGEERNRTVETENISSATATVRGTSSALYLWTWNRPAPVHTEGDEATIHLWQRIRI
ncbi:MAG: maleylpyruvate isomerase family mycothiol-dependent enzyme [Jatrophihabitans sp.]